MNQPAHKTKGENRIQTMRFYPFVFLPERMRTACDRSGANGNGASSRGTRRADNARGQFETGRFLFWTEDSRMHAAVDDKHYSYYAYDHSGGSCASREQSQACLSYAEMEQRRRSQRRLKLVGDNCSMDVNAEYMNASSALNKPTLYPSPYLVLSMNEYTKHYYAGAERVAACLGGGGLDIVTHGANHSSGTDPTGTSASTGGSYIGPGYEPHQPEASEEEELKKIASQLQDTANNLFNQSYGQLANRRLDQNDPDCLWNVDVYQEELRRPLVGIPDGMEAKVGIDLEKFRTSVIEQRKQHHDESEYVYYYHSDHLGSASWITDHDGDPVQHLQYLPYGEPYVNIRTTGYSERFTFTGKERDEETGYGYFGARYMDHELMTMWLSVDPMADKYPSISPYAYCAWNPVKLVDPDGRDWVVIFDHEKKTVTVNAKYVTKDDEAHASAENAIKAWNNLSGKYSLMVGDEKYSVNFNLSVIDNSEAVLGDPELNAYKLVSELRNKDGEVDEKIMGETNRRIINVLESEKDNYVTSSHEIGHSLGLEHFINGTKGLMEEDGGRLSCCHEITKSNVDNILHLALHPEDRNPKTQTGVGSYKEIGSSKVDITNRFNLRLLKN